MDRNILELFKTKRNAKIRMWINTLVEIDANGSMEIIKSFGKQINKPWQKKKEIKAKPKTIVNISNPKKEGNGLFDI